MSAETTAFGLYLHIPFCVHRCPYCDFNTYAGLDELVGGTVQALCAEIAQWGQRLRGRTITSVFIGGGTPTVLPNDELTRLLETVYAEFPLAANSEITVEANPGAVDREKFEHLFALGVNRLSIGVQSFQPRELSFLGRIHQVEDVYAAFSAARSVGFDNINLDFIFGLPEQTPALWTDTLDQAIELGPEHLSLYSLIVEPNTPLHEWVETGRVHVPNDDVAGELYELAMNHLGAAGYGQYEVSNWMKDAGSTIPESAYRYACRHNLLYWRNGEYIGIGPGAHSHMRRPGKDGESISHRWGNVKPVPDYIRRVEEQQSLEEFQEELSARESMGETMMLGLRLLREGVQYQAFMELHQCDLRQVFADVLRESQAQGLLSLDEDAVRLTRRGLMMANQVALRFLPD